MKTNALLFAVVVVASNLHAQGTFQNLDFENPIPPLLPAPNGFVPMGNSFPGSNQYIHGNPFDGTYVNTFAISVNSLSLHNSLSLFFQPIQGNYSAYLVGVAIGQTGQIPQDAFTLLFQRSHDYGIQVTFAGQPIAMVQIGSVGNNLTMAGDVSMFAGQTGELLLFGSAVLDNIQFSNQAIPEPGVLALSVLGGLLLGWRLRRF